MVWKRGRKSQVKHFVCDDVKTRRMIALCKFVFFNVILGLSDVSTDFATFFDLWNEDHPLWAALTASWMTTPFCIHAVIFLIK